MAMQIDAVAVLGLGTMGHGIAQVFASAGHAVHCFDEETSVRTTLKDRVRKNLLAFVEADLMRRDEIDPVLARLTIHESEEETVRGAQFITEAIKEELALKQELFQRLEQWIVPDAILVSNSSTFPISQSGKGMQQPQRALVTHWFNPPHLVPLVEVVPGPATLEDVTRTTMSLMRQAGKHPLWLRKELPGFLVNRIQVAIQREVWDLLQQGVADAQEIDDALRASVGFRMAAVGPLEVHDFGGLDIQTTVYRNLVSQIRGDTELPSIVRTLVDQGHLGVKSGRGFHEYSAERRVERQGRRDALFLALTRLLYPPTGGEAK